MTVISLKNVKFIYDNSEKTVLDDISLCFEKGEFVSILGHNGSGKSTLAKLLNGLYSPTEGSVTVFGLDASVPENLWEIRSKVGMVFQNPDNQLIASIVEDDIAFGPENLGIEPLEIRKRIDEALAMVEMSKYIKKPPHQLSGGQKQRIAIAGVMAMRPDVVVFDEPTSMLDPVGRREVLETIEILRNNGITVILITHYMEEALQSDRVIVLHEGKVALDSTPENVFDDAGMLKELSLKLPDVYYFAHLLRSKGLHIKKGIRDYLELTGEIIKLKDKLNTDVNLDADNLLYKYADKPNVISLKSVNYYYNKDTIYEYHAIRDMDLTVNKGEYIGIIGSTGSGKSSLVQLLNGLNKVNSGNLEILDFSSSSLKPDYINLRKRVGLVFQYPEYQLFEETVFKDVSFGPRNLGVSEESLSDVVNTALSSVSLNPDNYVHLSPFELSGGEKRRVAIAGVLAMEPDVLILDEPAAGLDPVSRDEILGFIKKEHMRDGRTTVIVSHDMREIARYCDRVIVLAEGKVVMFDEPKNVYKSWEILDGLGLDVPVVTKVIAELNQNGFAIDEGIFDIDFLVSKLTVACGGSYD